MARKTNKTNHVLGLLAGKNDESAEVGAATSEATQSAAEQKDNTSPAPNVQIVAKQEEDDMIADTVMQMLEEELEAEEIELPEPAKAAAEDKVEEDEMMESTPEDIKETVVQEVVESEVEEMQNIAEETKLPEKPQEEQEIEADMAEAESDYVFLNVMEELVRDVVDKYIIQFGTCTCSRCKADVIALALTNLPPKYEVVARNEAAPLMNFYSRQFSGPVTVEITKACTMVKDRPHHNRD